MQSGPWDVFCRVIDNFGDVGVSWRLCTALAARGHAVRLYIDDASGLAWMAPHGAPGVQVLPWADALVETQPGNVVIETFGCALPDAFVARMAAMATAPLWINLEYLSAEPYVERCHGLRSPQFSGPGAGLDKWFFYPGFTPATGGLLRDPPAASAASARAWLAARGWGPAPGERAVLLFGYASAALPALLAALADAPPLTPLAGTPPAIAPATVPTPVQPSTLLWLPPGGLRDQLGQLPLPAGLRPLPLPWLPSTDFDQLLLAADLKLVRGEDSFVRAQLLGAGPLLWQIYPQDDGAHAAKLNAWLDLHLAGSAPDLALAVRRAQQVVNGLAPSPLQLPDLSAWSAQHRRWQANLLAQADLIQQLLAFVAARSGQKSG